MIEPEQRPQAVAWHIEILPTARDHPVEEEEEEEWGVTGLRKRLRRNRPSIVGTQPAREGVLPNKTPPKELVTHTQCAFRF